MTLQFVTPKAEPMADRVVTYRTGRSHWHESAVHSITTDALGTIVLEVPPGMLHFEMPVVPKEFFPVRWAGVVGEDHHQQTFTIKLSTWHWVKVVVKDLAGKGIARAGVTVRPPALPKRGLGVHADPVFDGGVWTDAQGHAMVRMPNAKGLMIQAIHDQFHFLTKSLSLGTEGVTLLGADASRSYVSLFDQSGRAIEGVEFWFLERLPEVDANFSTISTGTSLADGWIPLPESAEEGDAEWMFVVGSPGYDYRWKWVSKKLEEPLLIQVAEATTIQGQVVDANGKPLAHVEVKTEAPIWMGVFILFHPDFQHLGSTHTDHEGRFQFSGLAHGNYRMETVGVEPTCFWKGNTAENAPLLVPQPAPKAPLPESEQEPQED